MTRRATRFIYISFVFALIGGAILLRYSDPFFVRALRLIAFDHFQRLDPEPYDPTCRSGSSTLTENCCR